VLLSERPALDHVQILSKDMTLVLLLLGGADLFSSTREYSNSEYL